MKYFTKKDAYAIAFYMDCMWNDMNREGSSQSQHDVSGGFYVGTIATLAALCIEWTRDDDGHHHVFLDEISDQDVGEQKAEK